MNRDILFKADNIAVGYGKEIIVNGINIELEQGRILSLIGPNGAGKSTILKSIARQIGVISGTIEISNKDINRYTNKEIATKMSVMLTEKISSEFMTSYDVVSAGRYPYTNYFGKLTSEDKAIIYDALKSVDALEFGDREFVQLSDGQKQRILLARAICQEPEILILDEPTSYLDIKYKVELLDILKRLVFEKKITVIMSIHEVDLAVKVSDILVCVKGEEIFKTGTPREIYTDKIINELYDIKCGHFSTVSGSVELAKSGQVAKVFVIAGNGMGTGIYRDLQRHNIPFATGIIYENDIDYPIAQLLANKVYSQKAFTPIEVEVVKNAKACILECDYVIDSGAPVGEFNRANKELLDFAIENNITVGKVEALYE